MTQINYVVDIDSSQTIQNVPFVQVIHFDTLCTKIPRSSNQFCVVLLYRIIGCMFLQKYSTIPLFTLRVIGGGCHPCLIGLVVAHILVVTYSKEYIIPKL